MASLSHRLNANVAGDFFVDDTCIDCDICRQLAPATFRRDDRAGQSVVTAQPTGSVAMRRALMALVACPTASIGSAVKHDPSEAVRSFPEEIEGGVYFCGYAAEESYGASSYLVRRAGGNVLVDSPRAARPLLTRLQGLGGVRTMFLTHRDDVADHAKFRRVFGCDRVMHAADIDGAHEGGDEGASAGADQEGAGEGVGTGGGTVGVEHRLLGSDPVALAPDLVAIPVPGHTRGSAALLYGDRFLFTGDHLWADQDTGRLEMGRSVCWYSWPEQVRSLRRLLDFRFQWVLPGHGRRFRARTADDMRAAITDLLRRC